MKNKLYTLGVTGFAAAMTFGLSACGDDVTKYYDSEGGEISVSDTLLVTEVIKDYDTVKVTDVVTKYDTVSATEIVKSIDTVKTTVVVQDTIRDTINVEVIPEAPVADLIYGTVNLSFAQFYYGELNDVAGELNASEGVYDKASASSSIEGYDAFTSATTAKIANFKQINGEVVDTKTEFKGVLNVDVAISKALYEDVLKNGSEDDKSDLYALVKAATWSEDGEAPVNYKVINSDGSVSKTYGAVAKRTPSSAELLSTTSYGDYQINFSSADIFEVSTATIQGVVLEDEFGGKYGLVPLGHIWLQTQQMAFSVGENCIGHGTACAETPYEQFTDIAGKNIVKATYFVKDNHNVELSTKLFVPYKGTVAAGKATVTTSLVRGKAAISVSDFTTESVTFTVGDTIVFNIDNVANASALTLTAYGVTEGRTVNYTDIANGGAFSTGTPYVVFDSKSLPKEGGTFTFKFEDATGLQATATVSVEMAANPSLPDVEDLSGVVYGTVDLSYAQFFYGEFNNLEGDLSATAGDYASASVVSMDDYDAYTSATTGKYSQFTQAATTLSEDNNSVSFDGVKAVNVVISKALLREAQAKIAAGATAVDGNDLLALVAAATWDETASEPAEYKVINANGSVSKTYGKTVARTPSSVEVTTGSHWGDYEFAFDAVSINDLTGANVQAVILETEDGAKYGLVPLINVWMNVNNLGFFVGANSDNEPYAQFTDIPGKRMVKATYFTKDGNDVELDFNVYMPQFATIQMGTATYDATAKTYTDFTEATEFQAGDVITLYSVPANRYSTMKLAQYGTGTTNARGGVTYTYTDIANGGSFSTRSSYVTYTIPSDWTAGSYSLKFVDNNGIAADVVLTFTVTAAE